MNTWPNRGASGGPCGGRVDNETEQSREVRSSKSDSSQQASSKPGAVQFKDGREVAMRGDDFIGVGADSDDKLWLLKGESKSRTNLGNATIGEAREALNRYGGRCTPDSLLFVANRLLESDDHDDVELGRTIRDEVGIKALRASRIDHMLFTISGNAPQGQSWRKTWRRLGTTAINTLSASRSKATKLSPPKSTRRR